MKRSACLLASGVALGLAALPVMAQQTARTTPSFIDYVGIGLAISDVPDLDNGTALVVNAGKNITALQGLSVEGEFTTTLTKPETDIGGVDADVSYWTLGGYGAYALPVAQQFDLRGRLGIVYESVDGSGESDDQDEFNVSAGVGASFYVSKNFAVTADFTRMEEDLNHYGAGVKFRF